MYDLGLARNPSNEKRAKQPKVSEYATTIVISILPTISMNVEEIGEMINCYHDKLAK